MTIRAAFDIGSSHHKLVVAELSGNPSVPQILFSTSLRVPLADALSTSTSTSATLPATILAQSTTALQTLVEHARRHGATQYAAIATQIFRASPAAARHLSSLSAREKIPVHILSQFEEGVLAFRAATRLARLEEGVRTVVWDSGGASSQWTFSERAAFRVHGVPIGSAVVRGVVAGGGGGRDGVVDAVRRVVREKAVPFPDGLDGMVAEDAVVMLGIGGASSMFAMAAERLGAVIRVGDVEEMVGSLGEGDVRLPKMVMLAELMAVYGIRDVRYVAANGSCVAMIVSEDERFWGAEGERAGVDAMFAERRGTSVRVE